MSLVDKPTVLLYLLLVRLFHVNASLLYFYTMDETVPTRKAVLFVKR